MIFILAILLVVAITVALYYKSKAEEFENLFELSKEYRTVAHEAVDALIRPPAKAPRKPRSDKGKKRK